MATLELREADVVDLETAGRLTHAAVELNQRLGDPTRAAG